MVISLGMVVPLTTHSLAVATTNAFGRRVAQLWFAEANRLIPAVC